MGFRGLRGFRGSEGPGGAGCVVPDVVPGVWVRMHWVGGSRGHSAGCRA